MKPAPGFELASSFIDSYFLFVCFCFVVVVVVFFAERQWRILSKI